MNNPVDKVDNSRPGRPFCPAGPVVAVFAKEPLPGRVKTRLCPPLAAEQAATLYRIALHETITGLLSLEVPLVLCYAGRRTWFAETFPGLPLLAQSGGGLGERLAAATAELFSAGAAPLVLTGSDSPDLPRERFREAFARLQGTDVVTVPCTDGGYALIGLRQASPEIFREIPWSTAGVTAATRQQARQLGLSYHELAAWEDLDDVAALQRLLQRSPATVTAAYIRDHLADLW